MFPVKSNPMISVVIPTRNRLKYLQDALGSVLEQGGLEVIVADNATTDGTREYLDGLKDRIKVTRSETPLSMSDNWYRGLELVTGEWVIFIGDDDCLMPDFRKDAERAIAQFPNAELFAWDTPIYRWPSSINEDERDHLQFTLRPESKTVSSSHTLKRMFENLENILQPPGLYHHLSKTSLIQKTRERFGEYRLGKVPDLGSGILYLAMTREYIHLPRPLSVMAFGSQSTGMSHKNAPKDYGPRAEFDQLSRPDELEEKYPLAKVSFNANVLQWRLLLEWQDYLKTKGIEVRLNEPKMLEYCLARLNKIPAEERADSAEKLIAYGIEMGGSEERLTAIARHSLNTKSAFGPHIRSTPDNALSIGLNLSRTPIKTASQAAGLIAGFQV